MEGANFSGVYAIREIQEILLNAEDLAKFEDAI